MRYRVSEAKVAWRVVDGEGVIVHADTSAYFGLNRTATLIWRELADRALAREEISRWARHRFPDSPPKLDADVAEFIAALQELDLLEETEDRGNGSSPGDQDTADEFEAFAYERPEVLPFGELEKLILSGE